MAAVSIAEALAIEAAAKSQGWTEEQLVDCAGANLATAIARFFPRPGLIVGYLGKGHNAADAWVALRILRDRHGWRIAIRAAYPMTEVAPLVAKKWREAGAPELAKSPLEPPAAEPWVLLDGLSGTGSKGELRSPLRELATEMNRLRVDCGARVAAIDLPSGIDAETGAPIAGAVTADVTFMIGNPKRGLLNAHAANATGALACVPVAPLAATTQSDIQLISPQECPFGKGPRAFDFHKGNAGRVAILAGSLDYSGAAVLAATGALRGGAGLITLWVPTAARSTVSAKCPPEIIVRGWDNPREVLQQRCDALVVGCGLGELDDSYLSGLIALIQNTSAPAVIDADALNALAKAKRLEVLAAHHVITPHPGEFQRLAPDLQNQPREAAARVFADRTESTLVLKGSRTLVTQRNEPLRVNSTGTPAMASGGQGDLLAGVIAARLAIGDRPVDAASLGAWICGRAAEIALNDPRHSEDSLTPSDVLEVLGTAFNDWRAARR
jgi:hydroxyethylthiazole kinase-like uncharacterized protein yjeF